uniref:LisH domain-containing protein n=1 Tax=Kalanchoe fedtschenkoi TaxID=63787 RepID=A0A7N0TYB7_KALFE
MDDGPAAGEEVEASQATPQEGGVEDEIGGGGGGDGSNLVVEKSQKLIDRITSTADRPNAKLIHALASILEKEEAKYMEETGQASIATAPLSHTVGQLGALLRDNDEFFELISSKFLTERQYSTSVKAATVRLLISCSQTWMFPHIFEESVVENIKGWVMDDSDTAQDDDDCNWTEFFGRKMPTNAELLKTYSTGLLVVCLAGDGGQAIEDVLTSGLPAKLMHYLRNRVLRDSNLNSKLLERDNVPGENDLRTSRRFIDEQRSKRGDVESVDGHGCQLRDTCNVIADASELKMDVDNRRSGKELRKGKNDDMIIHEHGEGPSSRSKLVPGESTEKGRIKEVSKETEQVSSSSTAKTYAGHVRSTRDRKFFQNSGLVKKDKKNLIPDVGVQDNFECFQDCRVGSRDISDMVIKAVKAAAAEARDAKAPEDAVKAAVDAAAEVVRTAALEEFEKSNDEEAAAMAASEAAFTIIDAANVVEVSRRSYSSKVSDINITEPDIKELIEDLFIRDSDDLAKLREKFSIQCLEVLGEYVEVLGPVVHEKGVDVCIELLLRCSMPNAAATYSGLLPDVLKLICALCAHRKFAAMFVDRDGIQKLLAVARVDQTLVDVSSCLFTIGSLQGIMERVCALPSEVVHQVVRLALELLECSQDQARKNAALFFNAAFVFQAILDSFDSQDGLQKLLGLLHDAAFVRSGTNSGAVGLSGAFRNNRAPPEVLTSSEKQIAFHTCVALRQYFRAHLLLLVESVRPTKINRTTARNALNIRAPNKPLDISNEAMDAVFIQLQKDRKLGSAFVRAKWPAVERFLSFGGHNIMLELCQAPSDERYLHDLVQYALGVLHIVTLVPYSRKLIVNASLSNDRVGIAVILDAANIVNWVEAEIIESALCVLVNLVCPPPSISNKPALASQSQQSTSVHNLSAAAVESRERNAEKNSSSQLERNADILADRGGPQTPASGLVGDRRISLGSGAGGAGLAAQLEQGYRQARESVRANNGIKFLLLLLQPRAVVPPASLDCVRALACRVLLGLARDDAIAHILTKLQVGKKLSELIRDVGNQAPGTEQGRWQAELTKAAIELITIVTNSGRSSNVVANDAATPTLRRIERAAIAAATPISYEPRELFLLMHEHLVTSGLDATAATLLKEAQLKPLPSLAAPSSLSQYICTSETPPTQLQWPCGRAPSGFLADKTKVVEDDDSSIKYDSAVSCKKRSIVFSSSLSFRKNQPGSYVKNIPSESKAFGSSRHASNPEISPASPSVSKKDNEDKESQFKTPLTLPMKRKLSETGGSSFGSFGKRLNTGDHGIHSPVFVTPNTARKSSLSSHVLGLTIPGPNSRCHQVRTGGGLHTSDNHQSISGQMTPLSSRHFADAHLGNGERFTLDSIMLQHLKNQHRQCPAPITTVPPLSLLHPHVCPEPRQSLDAPLNVTARLERREFQGAYGDFCGNRRDRQFIYSRFRPWRTCRDDLGDLLTCITFLGDSYRFAVGTHNGELKIFDTSSSNVIESSTHHQANLTHLESHLHNGTQLVLSSTPRDVCLWDASSIIEPQKQFGGCKAARFSNLGSDFAALSADQSRREILLYDIQTSELKKNFVDTVVGSSNKRHGHSFIHFSPDDSMLLWNGTMWDLRSSNLIKRFEQLTDYGGGGFHPAGNEVIINSEVWDIRNFKLLRSVPSLDQTVITFNPSGNVIYAILRRNLEDITSATNNRRVKDPLFAAFRTVDAVNYSDIATVPVDRCVLDFAAEPTDSVVGLVTMDDQDEMFSSARIYEIGRRRPMDDDSDPDDDADTDEEESDSDEDVDNEDPVLGPSLLDEADGMSEDDSLGDIEEEDAADDVDLWGVVSSGGEDDMDSESDDDSFRNSDDDSDGGFGF